MSSGQNQGPGRLGYQVHFNFLGCMYSVGMAGKAAGAAAKKIDTHPAGSVVTDRTSKGSFVNHHKNTLGLLLCARQELVHMDLHISVEVCAMMQV